VVLAFRLSGIAAPFPGIVTHKAIVDALRESEMGVNISFAKRTLKQNEILQFLKGERWQSGAIYSSCSHKGAHRSIRTIVKDADKYLGDCVSEGRHPETRADLAASIAFVEYMQEGPDWAKAALDKYTTWVKNDLIGALQSVCDYFKNKDDPTGV
jgi:hypothetical protein